MGRDSSARLTRFARMRIGRARHSEHSTATRALMASMQQQVNGALTKSMTRCAELERQLAQERAAWQTERSVLEAHLAKLAEATATAAVHGPGADLGLITREESLAEMAADEPATADDTPQPELATDVVASTVMDNVSVFVADLPLPDVDDDVAGVALVEDPDAITTNVPGEDVVDVAEAMHLGVHAATEPEEEAMEAVEAPLALADFVEDVPPPPAWAEMVLSEEAHDANADGDAIAVWSADADSDADSVGANDAEVGPASQPF